jgi:hypothetical protein
MAAVNAGSFPDPPKTKSHARGRLSPKAPAVSQAERVASDLYHASRIFRIPLTFLSSAAWTDWARGGECPATIQIYGGALAVAALVNRSSRLWDPLSPHICDLDELAHVFSAASRSSEDLRLGKEALARASADETFRAESTALGA